ncbi:hypothetical protein Tco_1424043 [Tanacetum coccineum]
METFAPNDKADYYSGITSITVNGKNAYELKGKFLDDLHNNAFSGTNRKDVVEHIEYYPKSIDTIKLTNVDHDKLRILVFPISLAGGARIVGRYTYPGKLKSKWNGPNIVKTVYPHGAIEITDRDRFTFKFNGQRLKKYYGGDIDKEDDEVIELENYTHRVRS